MAIGKKSVGKKSRRRKFLLWFWGWTLNLLIFSPVAAVLCRNKSDPDDSVGCCCRLNRTVDAVVVVVVVCAICFRVARLRRWTMDRWGESNHCPRRNCLLFQHLNYLDLKDFVNKKRILMTIYQNFCDKEKAKNSILNSDIWLRRFLRSY